MNPVFATDEHFYGLPKTSFSYRREFVPAGSTGDLATGLAIAAGLAIVSSRLGLWWGRWMRRVMR
jgi:hypothetical protein